eukprot:1380265-Amphidinium_carterae.1
MSVVLMPAGIRESGSLTIMRILLDPRDLAWLRVDPGLSHPPICGMSKGMDRVMLCVCFVLVRAGLENHCQSL